MVGGCVVCGKFPKSHCVHCANEMANIKNAECYKKGLNKGRVEGAIAKQKEIALELKSFITNGWSKGEIEKEWKIYLETELKPFFPKLYNLLLGGKE